MHQLKRRLSVALLLRTGIVCDSEHEHSGQEARQVMHAPLTTSAIIGDHREPVPAALRQQQRVQSLQRGAVLLSERCVSGQHPSLQQILVVAVAAIAHAVGSPGRLAVARILRVTPATQPVLGGGAVPAAEACGAAPP